MYLPSVERFKCHGKGLVGYSVIEQTAYDADASVGIALREAERVRGMVIIERDFAWMVWILLPFFTVCPDNSGVMYHRWIRRNALHSGNVFIQDFHDSLYFDLLNHVRLREPVFFNFSACLTVPWPYPQGLAKGKLPQPPARMIFFQPTP